MLGIAAVFEAGEYVCWHAMILHPAFLASLVVFGFDDSVGEDLVSVKGIAGGFVVLIFVVVDVVGLVARQLLHRLGPLKDRVVNVCSCGLALEEAFHRPAYFDLEDIDGSVRSVHHISVLTHGYVLDVCRGDPDDNDWK